MVYEHENDKGCSGDYSPGLDAVWFLSFLLVGLALYAALIFIGYKLGSQSCTCEARTAVIGDNREGAEEMGTTEGIDRGDDISREQI